jgi:hypothetical protein
MYWEAA